MPARGSDPSIPLSLLKAVAEKGFEGKLAELQEAEANAAKTMVEVGQASANVLKGEQALEKERKAFEAEKAEHAKFVQQMDDGFEAKQAALDERKAGLDHLAGTLDVKQEDLDKREADLDRDIKELKRAQGQLKDDQQKLQDEWRKLDGERADLAAKQQRLNEDLKNIGSRLEGLKLTA